MDRVQKILANAGVASRRKCEDIIRAGRVKVNGKTSKIGDVASEKDKITVDDKQIKEKKKLTIIMNKPRGYVTTTSEYHGMKTVLDLVNTKQRIYPIGRLDKNTQGLLLLSNDGDLTYKLTHPKHGIKKRYVATLNRMLNRRDQEKIELGTKIDGKKVKVHDIETKKNIVILEIHEGRTHIIKRLFEEYDYKVVALERIQLGPLRLGDLQRGKTRVLKENEIKALKAFINQQ